MPKLRIPSYRGAWQTYRLGDLASRVTRKNTNKQCSEVLTIAAQYGLVSQEEFFNKTVASSDVRGYYLLRNGEFAYNKSYSGDYSWGAIKRLDNFAEGILTTLYICFELNSSFCDSDYMVHYFESTKWQEEVKNIAGEGARNHGLLNVSIVDFFNTSHNLPCINEQIAIAKVFNSLTSKLKHEETYLNQLSKQRTYLLRTMFI